MKKQIKDIPEIVKKLPEPQDIKKVRELFDDDPIYNSSAIGFNNARDKVLNAELNIGEIIEINIRALNKIIDKSDLCNYAWMRIDSTEELTTKGGVRKANKLKNELANAIAKAGVIKWKENDK